MFYWLPSSCKVVSAVSIELAEGVNKGEEDSSAFTSAGSVVLFDIKGFDSIIELVKLILFELEGLFFLSLSSLILS